MADCCSDKACEVEALRRRQGATLRIVLALNAAMFVVELGAGLRAGSLSLVADSLDMLGDALVYGFSLYVVARGPRMKAWAALVKGGIMAGFAVFVLVQAGHRILTPGVPSPAVIGGVGALALAVNAACLGLLWRHRSEDLNMRSVWLCSRNDIAANLAVLVAALGVRVAGARWPDVVVGLAIAALFTQSAVSVLRGAAAELRRPEGGSGETTG